MSENHVYSIDLDLKANQASKQTLKELQSAFENSGDSIDELNKTYKDLADNTTDILELNKQYNKVIEKSIAEKDKLIDKLKAEQVKILTNKDLTEEQKDAKLKMLNASIKSIEVEKKILKSKSKEVQLETKMKDLVKADLQSLKDKVKEQLKFISALKTTEGRYKAIKKVASVGIKAGAKIGIGLGGLAVAGAGMAMASAQSFADKDRALGSLKGNIDPALVDKVQVGTGADYSTIIAAINRISDLNPKSKEALVAGAIEEIFNPGMGRMLLLQSKIDDASIQRMINANAQIRKQTGSQDLSAAYSATEKIRAVSHGKVGQMQAVQAYAALQQVGLAEDAILRIISSVAKKEGDFITNLNKEDLTKYVRGQEKNLVQNAKLNLSALDLSKSPTKTKAQELAEKMREIEIKKNEMIAKFVESMDVGSIVKLIQSLLDLAVKMLPPFIKFVAPAIEKITKSLTMIVTALSQSKNLEDFLNNMYNLQAEERRKQRLERERQLAYEKMQLDAMQKAANAVDSVAGKYIYNLLGGDKNRSDILHQAAKFAGGMQAQGGLVTAPSLCGEAGPELVIPLDNSRAGRASQIINNFNTNQSFNVAANQRTELSFSQVVGQNRFIKRYAGL